MVLEAGAAKKSEEVSNGAAPTELPFLNVQRYLNKHQLRVPEVFRYDEAAGILVLEDLGPETFELALARQDKHILYAEAVDLLARFRLTGEKHPSADCIAFQRSFDAELYRWELHHFREWGMEAWSGRTPSETERQALESYFEEITRTLVTAPTGLTHRDYQSRNLMRKGGELVIIDFQDALLGPRQYDLVALLKDSYVELETKFVEEMLHRYISAVEAGNGERIDRPAFIRYFHLLTVQRKAKDAARFEFISRVKKNDGFLPSIPASLRAVRGALELQPQLADFRKLVSKFVPELG
jgi:N-acetylmuramate 1-kinase